MELIDSKSLVQFISWFIYLLPYAMTVLFAFAMVMRWLIYYTVRRQEWFAREFEKRVNNYVDEQNPGKLAKVSFYVLSKQLLERSFYEAFELRDRMRRRKQDAIMSMHDRIFLVKQGCAWLVKDLVRQIKFLKWTSETPKLVHLTRSTFQNNPVFNRIFGIIPMGALNDFLSILPGLFVVAGILGTFLGIRGGIETLSGMSLENLEMSQKVVNHFLSEIAYAMTSSVIGILFSLLLHIYNTFFSPERAYVATIDRFENSLDLLWYRSTNNDYPLEGVPQPNRDPMELLAEETLNLELAKSTRTRSMDETRKPKVS